MRASARFLTLITLLTLSAITPMGCTVKTVSRSSGTATVGSREVKYSLDGNGGGVLATSKSATISFADGEVIVDKQSVFLDGKEVAKLPEDGKVVSVDYAAGTLTITADGKTLHEVKLGK